MHASPPFQMTVRHFGLWRAASMCTVLGAVAVVGVWAARSPVSVAGWVAATGMLLVLLSMAVGLQAWRMKPVSLRWDTQRWHLGSASSKGHEPFSGSLTVSVDLGVWMLLHFRPDTAAAMQRGTWLPVQRRGHEASWHALRCTVYCARPVSLPTVAPF